MQAVHSDMRNDRLRQRPAFAAAVVSLLGLGLPAAAGPESDRDATLALFDFEDARAGGWEAARKVDQHDPQVAVGLIENPGGLKNLDEPNENNLRFFAIPELNWIPDDKRFSFTVTPASGARLDLESIQLEAWRVSREIRSFKVRVFVNDEPIGTASVTEDRPQTLTFRADRSFTKPVRVTIGVFARDGGVWGSVGRIDNLRVRGAVEPASSSTGVRSSEAIASSFARRHPLVQKSESGVPIQ